MAQQKADMQRQYAAQLQQDQAANKRQETPDVPGGGVGPGLQIGGYESAMAQQKADMQRQYAAQLQQDQAANQDMNRSQSLPGGGGLQVGGYESAMAQQKADMQRQYAAQLQQDQANKRQETPDMPGGGVGGTQQKASDWRLRECDGSAKGRYAEAVCGSAAAGPGGQ